MKSSWWLAFLNSIPRMGLMLFFWHCWAKSRAAEVLLISVSARVVAPCWAAVWASCWGERVPYRRLK